jgi:hypothetical protein
MEYQKKIQSDLKRNKRIKKKPPPPQPEQQQ